jgi:protein CWC15
MTTAHRPTYNSAVGGSEQGGNKILVPSRQYSAKELPGQLSMKERPPEDFSKKDFKEDLKAKESAYQILKNVTGGYTKDLVDIKETKEIKKEIKEEEKKYVNPFPQDADDENFKNDSSEESEDSSEFLSLFI